MLRCGMAIAIVAFTAAEGHAYVRHYSAEADPRRTPTVNRICPNGLSVTRVGDNNIPIVLATCNNKVTAIRWQYCVTDQTANDLSNPQFDRVASLIDLAADGRLICASMRPSFIDDGSRNGGPGANSAQMPPGPWAQNKMCGDGFHDTFSRFVTGFFYATCFSLSANHWVESSIAVKDCATDIYGVNKDGQLTCETKDAILTSVSGKIKCYKISTLDQNAVPTLFVVLTGPSTADMSCDDEVAAGTGFAVSLNAFGQTLLKEVASATAAGLTATLGFTGAKTTDHINRDLTSVSVR